MRNRGTIGGSLANNDPAADYPAAVLALGATIVTNMRGKSPPIDFFRGMFETALEPGELITAVKFPLPVAAGYAKLQNAASRFALVGVFVAKFAVGRAGRRDRRRAGGFSRAGIEAALSRPFRARSPSTATASIRRD